MSLSGDIWLVEFRQWKQGEQIKDAALWPRSFDVCCRAWAGWVCGWRQLEDRAKERPRKSTKNKKEKGEKRKETQ
jgi:hypothetical protein